MVSIFIKVPANKPLETAFSLKSSSKSNTSASSSSGHGNETIITNDDLLQAKNKGRVQINNRVNLTVYPSYRNETKDASLSHIYDKIPLYELITLVVPAMVLLSAIVAFRIAMYSELHYWDAVFPSRTTCPIVLKLTIWGSLLVIVAYEYAFQFYGSKGMMNKTGTGNSEPEEEVFGLEVIVDDGYLAHDDHEHDNRMAQIKGHDIQGIQTVDSMMSTGTASSFVPPLQSEAEAIPGTIKPGLAMTSSNRVRNNLTSSKTASSSPKVLSNESSSNPSTPAVASVLSKEMSSSNLSTISKAESAASFHSSASLTSVPKATITTPRGTSTSTGSTPPTPASPTTPTTSSVSTPSSSTKPKLGPGVTPFRFIRATKGDVAAAKTRWADTCKWRDELGMDHVLSQPHPTIQVIKENYPHYFHLRGKKNECCYYEKPPKIDLANLRKSGIELEALLKHYAICCEYMWTNIEPSEEGKSIYVIDLEGMGFRDFAGEVVDFVKRASKFTGDHYPERSGSIFVINVPSWFSVIWNVVKPMVDDVTKQKITIMKYGNEAITKALMEKIDIQNIPPQYGGRSMPLGQSPEELQFMEHFKSLNRAAA